MRATGIGPEPVKPKRAFDPDVGSEGIVANLISELCRENPKLFFNHPGPDKIRKHQVRRLFIVTDFIGTGKRVNDYINSAWRVRSVKSWWSSKSTKGISFEVITYSSTGYGHLKVSKHPCEPIISQVLPCPTISSEFSYPKINEIKSLCIEYDPIKKDPYESLGFGGAGALIVFAHGAPNNSPRFFYKSGRRNGTTWLPIFPARVTATTRTHFADNNLDQDTIRERLKEMRLKKLAQTPWLNYADKKSKEKFVLLSALSRPPYDVISISRKTGINILDIERILKELLSLEWINGQNQLTNEGKKELNAIRKKNGELTISIPEEYLYYPTSLRLPRGVSS